ncbi:hypothetical protein THAOC_30645 [Thalassiosira oceanica]|uniref:Uncharacterized protein n=1 Tax=Thalassiosira oceanica TaxID=159749 RepID=K0R9U5_THAOC|nr:hypothetical protein THAOC_30645 [Thalassiosira oceanica]|eukprot:EJK50393.1 hypothetical protein THAOC_30645 [Thalassiosira oceanica]
MSAKGRLTATAATRPEVLLLYEGGEVAEDLRSEVTHVRVAPHVRRIRCHAFDGCDKLVEVQLNEGLLTIGEEAFRDCTALSSVNIPSTVTELGCAVFHGCRNLTEVLLNEGLQIVRHFAFARCTSLRSVTIPSTILALDIGAFSDCSSLTDVILKEGLQTIGQHTFSGCTELRIVTMPSTIINLANCAFRSCTNLASVKLNEGLQVIGGHAFRDCTALRSVTLPSTVTKLEYRAFFRCSNLSELIFLGGKRLLEQEFFARGLFSRERGLLNQGALYEIIFDENRMFAFCGCPLATVKVSISWALSERMSRLPTECRVSVEERIRNLVRLELMQGGDVLACFPLVTRRLNFGARNDYDAGGVDLFKIQDTNLDTAKSLYQVLQLIAFHELKESSILIDLAVWKSMIDGDEARADCRVAIPGPAKSLIMEYCGYAGFLRPAIDGA